MDKDIIAPFINNSTDRIAFLEDKRGTYRISGLDFFQMNGDCNFNDGNNYVFDKCKISDKELAFLGGTISFFDCIFNGNVCVSSVNSNGIITVEKCRDGENLKSFTVRAPVTNIIGNYIYIADSAEFSGKKGTFEFWFDDKYVFRNNIVCGNVLRLSFPNLEIQRSSLAASIIEISEYDSLIIDSASFSGTIVPIKREGGIIRENDTMIIDSRINGKSINNVSTIGETINSQIVNEVSKER